jgi:glycosyltransferase involved in cell wall biosynthesis
MKIFMLSAYFPPEVGSASHLFYELGSELVRRGHEITVLTGYPSYNIDHRRLEPRHRSGLWMEEVMNGIRVVRIRTIGMPRHIPVLRGIGQFTHALTQLFSGLFLTTGNADIVLVYSPPLFLGFTALVLRWFRNANVVVNVQDLFPQSAIDLGLLRSPLLIDLFRKTESFLYRHADAVTVHSEGNKEHVMRCGGSPSATHVVPNVVDTRAIRPGPRNNAFRERYRVGEQEFIVSFAGVIGYSQDLDTVIDAAKLLASQRDVVFYIVGEGLEKERLMRRAEGMANVRFLPMLPKNEYAELLHASDVCLVTLRKEVQTPVVPSKILSIMAAGRPVVASLPLHGDAPVLIKQAECGICVEPEKPEQLAGAIRSLYEQPERSMQFGKNGRGYVEQYCSVQVFAEQYEKLFRSLLEH